MKKAPRWIATAAALGTLTTLMVACGSGTDSSSGGDTKAAAVNCEPLDKKEKVKVGEVNSTSYGFYYQAREAGYFEDENITIEETTVRSSPEIIPALGRGQLDVVYAGLSPTVLNSIHAGVGIKFASGGGVLKGDPPASGLFVRSALVKSGEVTDVADLKGRKIGLTGGQGSAIVYLAGLILEDSGVGVDEIEIVNLGLQEMVGALQSGAVDAAYLASPFYETAEDDGIAERIGNQQLLTGQHQAGTLMGPTMLEDRPQVACAFLRATFRATEDFLQGDWRADDEVVDRFVAAGFKREDIISAPPYDYPVGLPLDSPAKTQDRYQKMFLDVPGILSYTEPIAFEDIVAEDLYEKALASVDE